ncbi:MAG: hypothetical protein KGO96_06845 [Elusimicrobia bacterium]|nr:hypothetical protein [Elusimicrobiota bacterium]
MKIKTKVEEIDWKFKCYLCDTAVFEKIISDKLYEEQAKQHFCVECKEIIEANILPLEYLKKLVSLNSRAYALTLCDFDDDYDG